MKSKTINAVKKVAIAYIFICVNFNLTINGTSLNLLPEWIGYLLLLSVWDDLFYDEKVSKVVPSIGLGLSFACWILAIMKMENHLLEIVYTVVALYDMYEVFGRLAEIAETNGMDEWSEKLRTLRILYIVLTAAGHALAFLRLVWLALIILLIDLIVTIYGLIQLFRFADTLPLAMEEGE